MTISVDAIKELRQITGASMMDCKKALEDSKSNQEEAVDILRKKGATKAINKATREAKEGVVASYIHSNKKLGSLVEINCETDFVARNPDFIALANDIAMQVAATNPATISPDEVRSESVEKEKSIWAEQLKEEKKPQAIIDKIMEGKEKKFREENALLTQPFIKNPEITIGKLIEENILKIGENIKVKRFERFQI